MRPDPVGLSIPFKDLPVTRKFEGNTTPAQSELGTREKGLLGVGATSYVHTQHLS
jgi:hypothetical protein